MFAGRDLPYGGYFLPIERFGARDALVRAQETPVGDGWLWFRDPNDERCAATLGEVAETIAWAEAVARSGAWAVGYVAYEAAAAFDAALESHSPRCGLPLACFRRYERPTFWSEIVFDQAPPAPEWRMEWDAERYADAFAAVRRALAEGESYQANLTFRMSASASGAAAHFARWAADDPPPYAWLWGDEATAIACLSPELFFERRGTELIGRPMKGTASTDVSPGSLPASAKERAENLMVVDMIRNDLGRVAHTGSVSVPALFTVERHGSLYQMTSTVRAESEAPLADVFGALFPCASIVGAPKIATTRLLTRLESSPRGVYTGAVGCIAPGGDACFAVAIRTATFFGRERTTEFGVGSGIVWDSRCESEWEECLLKRSALHRASPPWELLETMRFEPGSGIVLLNRHLERLARSAAELGVPFAEPDARAWLAAQTEPLAEAKRLRLRLSRAGTFSLDALPPRPTPPVLTAAWARTPVASQDRALRHKSTYRSAYARRLFEVATDEVLLWNERGEATEFANGSLIVDLGGRRVSPPAECGCLPGTYVADLASRGDVLLRPILKEEVELADRVAFANSVVGEIPVRLVGTD